jgi:hypothetical protein
MLIPLVPASLACNQQTDLRIECQGVKEGKDARLDLKLVASGMTDCLLIALCRGKRKTRGCMEGWPAGFAACLPTRLEGILPLA